MEFENLIKLINTVSGSDLTGFKYEADGIKIHMSKSSGKKGDGGIEAEDEASPSPIEAKAKLPESVQDFSEPADNTITSPLVGTFYSAPSEDADPFVTVGDIVKKGQTLAIIEAMKLMNEIESEYDGVIAEVLVKNGQPVEYGQPLFRISR